jgi:phosphoglycolate phosphatase-like HAD superfamily hydrolase
MQELDKNGFMRPGFAPRPEISHVIFDFDGTLSWLRHGWPRLMVDVLRHYLPLKPGETPEQADNQLMSELLGLNGKPTIFQMIHFESRVHERNGTCPSPETLRQEYQDRLDRVIEERSQRILSGKAEFDEYVVFGARAVVEAFLRRGNTPVILSGTIEHRVKEEAELLGLAPYFGTRIFGGTADSSTFSKRNVMERLLKEEGISGKNLLSFGDGPVEIAEAKRLGGVAIAIASNEDHNGSGIMDPWKYQQLMDAGADAILPDFRDPAALLQKIVGD